MQARGGSTSGAQLIPGSNSAGIQSYGPYRQRKRVLTVAIMTPGAERALDNSLLRWHWE